MRPQDVPAEHVDTVMGMLHAEECTDDECHGEELGDFEREAREILAAVWDAVVASGDGFHTMDELYRFRALYNAHATNGWLLLGYPVVKSWTHADGQPCFGGGWFIVVAELPSGQVSNHYEAQWWDHFHVPEQTPPAWDGHTTADAEHRLAGALTITPTEDQNR